MKNGHRHLRTVEFDRYSEIKMQNYTGVKKLKKNVRYVSFTVLQKVQMNSL